MARLHLEVLGFQSGGDPGYQIRPERVGFNPPAVISTVKRRFIFWPENCDYEFHQLCFTYLYTSLPCARVPISFIATKMELGLVSFAT